MMENELITAMAGIHGTTPFRADAESFGGWIFSVDSFSETEDFFTSAPPEIIGHNMAAGACSDILASGAKPEILLQSWNIDGSRPESYYREIAAGIESVLQYYEARCIGGDIGTSSPWLWSGTVGARMENPVKRIARCRVPFDLYASGRFGDVNAALFFQTPLPRLELREPVPSNALFATDSSGGFFDALENFRRVNEGISIQLDLQNVICQQDKFDPIYALAGGAGEYELLYAVPQGVETNGICIGHGSFSGDGTISWSYGKHRGVMRSAPPDYRSVPPEKWLEVTAAYAEEMSR